MLMSNINWFQNITFTDLFVCILHKVVMTFYSLDAEMEFLLPWMTARANISGTQRYIILTNLKPASSYEFRVSAVNGVGEGNPSASTEAIHLPPERECIELLFN